MLKIMVNKLSKTLARWEGNLLLLTNQVSLIKFVLTAIPLSFLSLKYR